jgi:hypothetical protein
MTLIALDLVKTDLGKGLVRLYSASNLGELVKRDADSGVVNIQFKQLKYTGGSHFDVKIVVTKDGNTEVSLPDAPLQTF